MSELTAYYESFRLGFWAEENPDDCLCHGHGWALSDVDTWHKCPIHWNYQPHPEDPELEACPLERYREWFPAVPAGYIATCQDVHNIDDIPF